MKDVFFIRSQPTAPRAAATLEVAGQPWQTFSKRPEYLKADSWSILFRATPGPTANRLIIEKWRAGLPSI